MSKKPEQTEAPRAAEPTVYERHSQADILVALLEAEAVNLKARLDAAYENRDQIRNQVLEAREQAKGEDGA